MSELDDAQNSTPSPAARSFINRERRRQADLSEVRIQWDKRVVGARLGSSSGRIRRNVLQGLPTALGQLILCVAAAGDTAAAGAAEKERVEVGAAAPSWGGGLEALPRPLPPLPLRWADTEKPEKRLCAPAAGPTGGAHPFRPSVQRRFQREPPHAERPSTAVHIAAVEVAAPVEAPTGGSADGITGEGFGCILSERRPTTQRQNGPSTKPNAGSIGTTSSANTCAFCEVITLDALTCTHALCSGTSSLSP
nr:uncharacterized protein LOC129384893 [Dermacentor andersoni]